MNDSSVDTRERIRWSFRRHMPLVIVLVIAGPLLAVGFGRQSGTKYRATALVVAQSLVLRQEQLPRFGEAVFTSGAVADAVAAELGIRTPSSRLIPNTISVVPMPDTVLFAVRGTASDAGESARLANSAAAAFVKELNKAGPGVGAFALQDVARRPVQPLSTSLAVPALVIVGLLAGLLLGVGVVALRVSVRRPVVDELEAALIVGAPVSASLTLGGTGPVASAVRVSGLARLVRSVFPTRTEQCAIVASPGAHRAGVSVAMLLAEYVKAPHVQANGSIPSDRRPLVVSAPELNPGSDVSEALLAADRRILVVMEGIPERTLRAVSRQFGPNDIDGVAFITTARHRHKKPKEAASNAAMPTMSSRTKSPSQWKR